jgi:hypothetical protein
MAKKAADAKAAAEARAKFEAKAAVEARARAASEAAMWSWDPAERAAAELAYAAQLAHMQENAAVRIEKIARAKSATKLVQRRRAGSALTDTRTKIDGAISKIQAVVRGRLARAHGHNRLARDYSLMEHAKHVAAIFGQAEVPLYTSTIRGAQQPAPPSPEYRGGRAQLERRSISPVPSATDAAAAAVANAEANLFIYTAAAAAASPPPAAYSASSSAALEQMQAQLAATQAAALAAQQKIKARAQETALAQERSMTAITMVSAAEAARKRLKEDMEAARRAAAAAEREREAAERREALERYKRQVDEEEARARAVKKQCQVCVEVRGIRGLV